MKPFLLGDPRLGRSIQKSIPKTNGKQFFLRTKVLKKAERTNKKKEAVMLPEKKLDSALFMRYIVLNSENNCFQVVLRMFSEKRTDVLKSFSGLSTNVLKLFSKSSTNVLKNSQICG